MDGILILLFILGILSIGCFITSGFIFRDGNSDSGIFMLTIGILVLFFLAATAHGYGASVIAQDEVGFSQNLAVGVPYKNLGNVKAGDKFIVILQNEDGDFRAYWFKELPPENEFMKVPVGSGYKYIPPVQ